jgi:hypothetical protein
MKTAIHAGTGSRSATCATPVIQLSQRHRQQWPINGHLQLYA